MTNPVLDHADERFVGYTKAASAIVRHLGFVAVAIIWLFGSGGTESDDGPREVLNRIQESDALSTALVLILGALVLDLAQYFWGASIWGTYHWILDQIFRGPRASAITWRERIAWRLARVIRFKQKLDFDLGLLKESEKMRPSVEDTRRSLVNNRSSSTTEVWSPAFINWVTNALFFAKVVLMSGAYACILYFVTQ